MNNKPMNAQDNKHDIKRLGKVIDLIEKINDLIYHMDAEEYERFKKYVYSRHEINFPATRNIKKD